MRFESVFVITFDAPSDAEAKQIAVQHHELFRDHLQVEGADHPHEIRLERLSTDGRDLLNEPREKDI
jgi:hypothetical protein